MYTTRLHVPGFNRPHKYKKKGKFNDISHLSVRKEPHEFKKPIPVDPILKKLEWYKEECPAIQESDEAGYLVSIDVLTEAKILRSKLEKRSPEELAAQELVEVIEPLPFDPGESPSAADFNSESRPPHSPRSC